MKPILTDAEAARIYGFRACGPFEPRGAYRQALIEHVASRDYAAAHELRVGRRQADWNAEDVDAFMRDMSSHKAARPGPLPPGSAVVTVEVTTIDPTVEAFLGLVADGFDAYAQLRESRRSEATAGGTPLAVLAHVVLTNGKCLASAVERGDRIAVLKTLCQRAPVFGFFLFADAFIHGIDKEKNTTSKRDALIMHFGTRELRVMRVRPYRQVGGRVEWDEPYEIDMRNPDPNVSRVNDPYAELFVSVPTEARTQ